MTIRRLDHVTILTTDTQKTVKFYVEVIGLTRGVRPNFAFPGAWLYCHDKPIFHIIEKPIIPANCGIIDHIAFWGEGLQSYINKLNKSNISYELTQLPDEGCDYKAWQLFVLDPNGACIEINFSKNEEFFLIQSYNKSPK